MPLILSHQSLDRPRRISHSVGLASLGLGIRLNLSKSHVFKPVPRQSLKENT